MDEHVCIFCGEVEQRYGEEVAFLPHPCGDWWHPRCRIAQAMDDEDMRSFVRSLINGADD